MIQPEAYYAAHKRCRTPEELGRLGFIIVGRGDELNPPPTSIELSFAETLVECNKWHTEKREELKEKEKERKRRYREHRAKNDAEQNAGDGCPTLSQGQDGTMRKDGCPTHLSTYLPNYLTTNLTTNLPNNNQSNTDKGVEGDIVIGSGLTELVDNFRKAHAADPTGSAFFDPAYDPAVIAVALTKDKSGIRRWRSALAKIGDAAMREELYAFYRELCSGDKPNNRGAALNARLKRMEGGK